MNNETDTPKDDNEWLIHECPHCDGKFKSHAHSEAVQMACPHCNEVVELGATASTSYNPAPLPKTPILAGEKKAEIPTGLKTTADLVKVSPSSKDWSPEKEAAESEKQKARSGATKKRTENNWESETREEKSKDETSIYYTEDPNEPGAVRVKHVRRKKNLTTAQKWIRYSAIGGIATAVIVTGVIIAMAIFQGGEIAANPDKALALPAPESVLSTKIASGEVISPIPTPEEIQQCQDIINQFIAAKTVDERVALVRTPERVRPMLEAIHPSHGLPLEKAKIVIFSKKEVDQERYFISIALSEYEAEEAQIDAIFFCAFQQVGKKILLDWEVTSRYQEMSFEDYISLKPKQPVTFRALVQPSDLLAPPYDDPEKYQSVVITYPGQPNFRMIGFFDLSAPWAAKFKARLEFVAPSVVVKIRFIDSIPEPFVEITEILGESWFLD
jgi:hypothetical protein